MEAASAYTKARSHFVEILMHCLRANQPPTKSSITEGALLDKRNQKHRMNSQRIIHLSDTIWKIFYGVLYGRGDKKEASTNNMPSHWHGFLAHRRREGAILVQRRTGWSLRRQKQHQINELHDCSNAFLCPRTGDPLHMSHQLVREDLHALAHQMLVNSIVPIPVGDKQEAFLLRNGGPQGSSEAPKQFTGVHPE
eukprot:713115-Pyramimonas_sp.AAC.1